MSRLQAALIPLILALLLALVAALPAPHPEARLFSDGWGASSVIDPNFCMTPIEGQPPRLALFPKTPAVAQAFDRFALAAQYLAWGLLLPLLALVAVAHPQGGRRHPVLLVFGALGAAPAWFQWPFSPGFVGLRQMLGTWLVEHATVTEALFVWIDGAALLLWLGGGILLLGGGTFVATWAAARWVCLDWRVLARDLRPLAAVTLFLGLTQSTALYLRGEGVNLDWLSGLRAALLALAIGGAGGLGWRTIRKLGAGRAAHAVAAGLSWLVPLALVAGNSWLVFFHWTNRYHV